MRLNTFFNPLIFISLSGLFLTGCFTTGKDFPSDLNWIKKEQTSKNDVKMLLGTPYSVGNSGGTPTWTYAFYEYRFFGEANHKELKFYWSPDQIVKHYNFSSSFPADTTETKRNVEEPKKGSSLTAPKNKSSNLGKDAARKGEAGKGEKKWETY